MYDGRGIFYRHLMFIDETPPRKLNWYHSWDFTNLIECKDDCANLYFKFFKEMEADIIIIIITQYRILYIFAYLNANMY